MCFIGTVKIRTNDNEARFIYFMISAEGDMKPDPRNPRRLISHLAGEVRPQDSGTAKFSDRCPNSVEQVVSNLKSSVEVLHLILSVTKKKTLNNSVNLLIVRGVSK